MKCLRCNWGKNENNVNCLPFWGKENADIVFVAEAFGYDEMVNYTETNDPEPLIGKSGKIFDELLDMVDIKREDIAIMNSIRCYDKGNKTPSKSELNACHIYTYRDIKKINPKLVVALGASAFYQTTGIPKDLFGQYVGKVIFGEELKTNIFVTYHPAAIIYDSKKKDVLVNNFMMIPSLIDESNVEIKHYKYELIDTILDILKASPIIYLDCETTGLNPYEDTIELLQISTGKEPIYILTKDVLSKIDLSWLEGKPIVGQGFEFDAKMLYVNYGIMLNNWLHDTCLAEYIISGMKDNDLTFLVSKYVPESIGYDNKVSASGGFHKTTDRAVALQYAADDVGVLPKIHRKQSKILIKNNTDWLYRNITLPCNKVLTKMSLRGVKYDLKELEKVDKKYEGKAEKALQKALTIDGIKECEQTFKQVFNPRSSRHVKWLLLNYYQLPVLKTTKKKNPSIGKEEMSRYAEKYKNPYCKKMEMYRSYQSIRDNFLSGVVPKLVDGVAHTKYSLHATASGRPNSRGPNLLNIPREKDIKRCIIAREGHKFVYSDAAQLEIRGAAVVYNDKRLLDICNTPGKDFHSMIGSRIYNVSYDDFYGAYVRGDAKITEDRVKAKAVSFGVIYQESADALAYQLKIKVSEAQSLIDRMFTDFPDLSDNIERTKRLLIRQGYLDNYFGFRRRWEKHTEEDHASLREGVNHCIQSLAWNLIQLALIKVSSVLEQLKLRSRLVLQIYDALVIETVDDEIDIVAKITKDAITTANVGFKGIDRVQLIADVEVGCNLADLEKFQFNENNA